MSSNDPLPRARLPRSARGFRWIDADGQVLGLVDEAAIAREYLQTRPIDRGDPGASQSLAG